MSGHVVLGGPPDALNGNRVSLSSSTPWTALSKSWGWSLQRGGNDASHAAHDGRSHRTRCRHMAGHRDGRSRNPCMATVPAWHLAVVLVTTSQRSPVQSGARLARVKSSTRPPLREEGTPILLRRMPTSGNPRQVVLAQHFTVPLLASPCSMEPAAVHETLADIVSRVCSRVCCGTASIGQEILNTHPGDTWHRLPLQRSHFPPIHAIIWVLAHETQGRAREGVARGDDTDTPTNCANRRSSGH